MATRSGSGVWPISCSGIFFRRVTLEKLSNVPTCLESHISSQWRTSMSAPQEPVDSKQENQKPDTSEQLEVNPAPADDAVTEGAEPGSQPAAAQEDLEAQLAAAEQEIARYHDELLRARAEIENVRRRAQED